MMAAASILATMPFARALGVEIFRDEEELITTIGFSQRLIGDIGVGALHGGAIAALAESTARLTAARDIAEAREPASVNLHVDYLRPGRPRALFASALLHRHGRGVATAQVTVWQDEDKSPVAQATCQLLLVAR